MATWQTYRGLDVPNNAPGDAGGRLKSDLLKLADGAPHAYAGDPTINDDTSLGYAAGALWWNTSSQILWVCTDAMTGSAKWKSLFRRVDNAIVLTPSAMVGGATDNRALQLDYAPSDNPRGANAVDLQRVRTTITQVAAGNQSAIIGGENNVAFSVDSFVGGGKANNAGGGSGTITNVSITNPTVVTSANHGLTTGQVIAVSGTSTTPTINGNRTVTVTGANTFTIPVNVTGVSVASGSWTSSATAAYAFVGGGQSNKALGKWSHAEGFMTSAIGAGSHAEGKASSATGAYAHAEGNITVASGTFAHAEGDHAWATGGRSHAEGGRTTASATYSHVEGYYSLASARYSHAEGWYASASGLASHAEGYKTVASGDYSHAGGIRSKARLRGQWARAGAGHNYEAGNAQCTVTSLLRITTNTSANEVSLDGNSPGSTNRFKVLSGQTLSCLVNIVGRQQSGGQHAAFLRHVCIRNDGNTTNLVGSVADLSSINPSGWGGVSISADDGNDSLKIEVTGNTSSALTIRWTVIVIASEVADSGV